MSDTQYDGAPVLITGGCGFIGSHLAETLVDLRARVGVLDNLQAGKWENLHNIEGRYTRLDGDVRSYDRLAAVMDSFQPQYVFHLAANASVPGSVQEPAYDWEANANGTFAVLNALRLAGLTDTRIVCVSSGAVYGEPKSFPIVETDTLLPISPYGASKLSAEIVAQTFHRVYKSQATVARIFNAYGPRMARFVILDFLKKLRANPHNLEILGNGKQIRDFTFVKDTVQGLLVLGARGEASECYNISSGAACSVTDLANRLIGELGTDGQTTLSYTGSSWVGDAQRWEVSIEKLRGLGYEPQYTMADGLRETIAWFNTLPGS